MAARLLDIGAPTALASDQDLPGREGPDCTGTLRLVRLCQIYGASCYLTGSGSRGYGKLRFSQLALDGADVLGHVDAVRFGAAA